MVGLYIHIPKCASRCAYCDFYSVTGVDDARLTNALMCEMESRRGFFSDPAGVPGNDFAGLDTIYVGGGTPSQLPAEQLQRLIGRARSIFGGSPRELTVEANPEDLTDDYLTALAETDFNRLSVGIQSFDDALLRLMNRRHTAERARKSVLTARDNGFDNISIDLIYGIPGMTDAQWERTLDEALGLGVQHISAYHLTIEPRTAFGRAAMEPVREAESERQYEVLRERLSAGGFVQYEVSNFSLPGRRSVHNSAYWSGKPYLGIGPSAHSFDGHRTRSWVEADVEKYLAGHIDYGGETLTEKDCRNERLMVELRTVDGIRTDEILGGGDIRNESEWRGDMDGELRRRVAKFLGDGLLVARPEQPEDVLSDNLDGGLQGNLHDDPDGNLRGDELDSDLRGYCIAIPPEKFLLSDYIISSLFE